MLVAVALSGGVDSSVAALLLRERHARLVGASHVVWPGSRCCTLEVLERARAVCRLLDIPYLQVDVQEPFRARVVEDFVRTYAAGRTPNPCVVCNREVRFDVFHARLAERLREQGLLAAGEPLTLATGHYARIVREGEAWFIAKGADPDKDQSYMLHGLRPQMLPHLLLPLGELRKAQVLEMARARGLDFSGVAESQDACFVEGSYVRFIEAQVGQAAAEALLRPGPIVDPRGRELGRHRGALHYTVGQRRGLGLGDGPWYVARIEPGPARITVARREQASRREFTVTDCNWFIEPPAAVRPCAVKIRYRSAELPCTLGPGPRPGSFRVRLQRGEILTPGQSAVFYDGDRVLGGGVIQCEPSP